MDIPIVFFDRGNDDLGISSVLVNDHLGAYMATEHLIKQDYKRIAHIAGPQHISIFKERLRGYRDALAKHKIKFDASLVYDGALSIDSGREAVAALLHFLQLRTVLRLAR